MKIIWLFTVIVVSIGCNNNSLVDDTDLELRSMRAEINGKVWTSSMSIAQKSSQYDLSITGGVFAPPPNRQTIGLSFKKLTDTMEYTIGDTNSPLEAVYLGEKGYTGRSGKLIFTSKNATTARGIFNFIASTNDLQNPDTVFITNGEFFVEITP